MLPTNFRQGGFFREGWPPKRAPRQSAVSLAVPIEILQQSTKVALTGRVSNLSVWGRCADAPDTLAQRACEDAPWNQASCRRILLSRSLKSWRTKAS